MLIDSLMIFKGFFGFVIIIIIIILFYFFCLIFVIKGVGRGFCSGVLRACSRFYGNLKENNIWHKMSRTRDNALMQTKLPFFFYFESLSNGYNVSFE